MMKTVMAAVAALGLTFATTASAQDDFSLHGVTVSAQTSIFNFEVEGTANNGVDTVKLGAEVFTYNIGDVESSVDVFGRYFRNYAGSEDFSIGAAYTVAYRVDAWSVYGSLEGEYLTSAQDMLVTPKVGTSYQFTPTVGGFAEVSQTWVANDSWSRRAGLAEVGVNIDLIDNVTLTPSIRHNFNTPGRDNTQAHVGLNFRF